MTSTKKPSRPKTVKVGWANFKILFVPDEEWSKKYPNHEDDGGLMWASDLTISIRTVKDAADQNYRETLLHEILHAIWFVTYLSAKKKNEFDDFEEEVIRVQSGPLLGILQDNPKVLAYLLG